MTDVGGSRQLRPSTIFFLWILLSVLLFVGGILAVEGAFEWMKAKERAKRERAVKFREKRLLARLAYLGEFGVAVRVDSNRVWLAFKELTAHRYQIGKDDYRNLAYFAAIKGHEVISGDLHVYVVNGTAADLPRAMTKSLFVCSITARAGKVVHNDCR